MANKDIGKKLVWIIAIIALMAFIPGEGTKPVQDQQAIKQSDYSCSSDVDCPTCVGGWFGIEEGKAMEEFTILDELAYSKCESGRCMLSDWCLEWDCNNAAGCYSVKQTLLDNTLGKIKNNPELLLALIAFIVVYLML